jgi:FkbM family methyltransferase
LLIADTVVEAKGIGRYAVRARCDDLYHVLPSQEPAVLHAVASRLRPGDVFVDGGANIGFYTVFAAGLVGPAGHVISIEMIPETFQRLSLNLTLNGLSNVTAVEAALSERSGELVEAAVLDDGRFGQASLAGLDNPKFDRFVSVRTTTLAEVLDNCARVRLVKLDLEGAEDRAITGALPVIDRIDALIFEQLPGGADIRSVLREHGFAVTPLDETNLIAERRV